MKTLVGITLRTCTPTLAFLGVLTPLPIQPAGRFIIGGPQGDAGLAGRKIILDTYGGWGAHGGGALSGKDPAKVDTSVPHVKSGLCVRARVQLSYVIRVAKPLSLSVKTHGTDQGDMPSDVITRTIESAFDCRSDAITQSSGLRDPKSQGAEAYYHFTWDPHTFPRSL